MLSACIFGLALKIALKSKHFEKPVWVNQGFLKASFLHEDPKVAECHETSKNAIYNFSNVLTLIGVGLTTPTDFQWANLAHLPTR
jgi:hypothetical protein